MSLLPRRRSDCTFRVGPRDACGLATWVAGCTLAGLLVCIGGARAASDAHAYPVRPVRVMVTFPAGGGVDLMARMMDQKLAENWGQPFVIDNRAGGGGAC